MSDPVLTIVGDPDDYLPQPVNSWPGCLKCDVMLPARCWLSVETLPIVTVLEPEWRTRPLRADDTGVTHRDHDACWFVTFPSCTYLHRKGESPQRLDLPGAKPGHWAVRVEGVEAS